jgi:hypothetical protein
MSIIMADVGVVGSSLGTFGSTPGAPAEAWVRAGCGRTPWYIWPVGLCCLSAAVVIALVASVVLIPVGIIVGAWRLVSGGLRRAMRGGRSGADAMVTTG